MENLKELQEENNNLRALVEEYKTMMEQLTDHVRNVVETLRKANA